MCISLPIYLKNNNIKSTLFVDISILHHDCFIYLISFIQLNMWFTHVVCSLFLLIYLFVCFFQVLLFIQLYLFKFILSNLFIYLFLYSLFIYTFPTQLPLQVWPQLLLSWAGQQTIGPFAGHPSGPRSRANLQVILVDLTLAQHLKRILCGSFTCIGPLWGCKALCRPTFTGPSATDSFVSSKAPASWPPPWPLSDHPH